MFELAICDLIALMNIRKGGVGQGHLGILLARDLSAALSFCHERGIAHVDIKPDNILLSKRGEFLLTDFGHAVPVVASGVSVVGGTLEYCAPECFEAGVIKYPIKLDMWAMGLVLLFATVWVPGLALNNVTIDMLDDKPVQDCIRSCLSQDPACRPDATQVWEVSKGVWFDESSWRLSLSRLCGQS